MRAVVTVALGGVLAAGIFISYAQQPAATPKPAQEVGRGGGRAAGGNSGFAVGLPPLMLPDSAYIRWVLTDAQQKYARISGARMKQYIHEIVAISEKSRADGVQNWGRHSGTIYDKMARDWSVQQFKRIGLEDIRDQPVTQQPRWWPDSWEASVVADGKTIPLKTVFALGGESTPAGGVTMPIVWVGLGSDADFYGRDVRGKAVLIHAMPTPTRRWNSAVWMEVAARARQLGANMLIVNLAFPGLPDMVTKPSIGSPSESLAISIGTRESDMIRGLIGQGKDPVVHYRQVVSQKGGQSGVVLAKLSGTTDEWIQIEAHTDGDFQGALDNASGMAELVELAEYFAAVPRAQRRRNILFVVHSDHHSGSAGLHWVEEHMTDVVDRMVANFVCEHPAQTQTYWVSGGLMTSDIASARRIGLGGTNGTETLRNIIRKGLKEFGVGTYTRPDAGDGSGGSGYSTQPPRIRLIDHTFYHTDMDVPELVPANGLEQATMAYAQILDEINKVNFNQIRLPKAPQTAQER